jgi:hypothetical protein
MTRTVAYLLRSGAPRPTECSTSSGARCISTETAAPTSNSVFMRTKTSFEVVYGATTDSGASEASGVQLSGMGSPCDATTFSCQTPVLTNGLKVPYVVVPCGAASPTPTATPPASATPTVTPTASPTGRFTPSPRSRPTPAPRP